MSTPAEMMGGPPPGNTPPPSGGQGGQAPQYLGFLNRFKRDYPDSELQGAAQNLYDHLDALFSNGKDWHDNAHALTYSQFVEYVAVVAASQAPAASSAPPTGAPEPPAGPKPATPMAPPGG